MAVEMMNGGVAIALGDMSPRNNGQRSKNGYGNSNAERQKPRMSAEERFEEQKARINRAIQKDGGRYIGFENSGYGILCCGVVSDKKFYFIWMNKDREIEVQSMKDTYKLIREIPANLSVLSYLYDNQRQVLREMVEQWLELNKDDYELVTEIGIKGFKPRKDGETNFTITPEIIDHFSEMEKQQFNEANIAESEKVWGLFGNDDKQVNGEHVFRCYYDNVIHFEGEHRMNDTVINEVLIPLIRKITKS